MKLPAFLTSEKTLKFLTVIIAIIATVQTFLPTFEWLDPLKIPVYSAVLMFTTSVFTSFKVFVSKLIANNALWPTFIFLIVAIAGGLNEMFEVIPVSVKWGQILRSIITVSTALIALFSEQMFPSQLKIQQNFDKTNSLK